MITSILVDLFVKHCIGCRLEKDALSAKAQINEAKSSTEDALKAKVSFYLRFLPIT